MNTDQRLAALERSVRRWRFFSVAVGLAILARFSIGAFGASDAQFGTVTAERLVIQGNGASITLRTDDGSALISMLSAENDGNSMRLHAGGEIYVDENGGALWLGSLGHSTVKKDDLREAMAAARKQGFAAFGTADHSLLTLRKDGHPTIQLGTLSPSMSIAGANGKIIFEK